MQIDEYESQFKRAHKAAYQFDRIKISRVTVVVESSESVSQIKSMLPAKDSETIVWEVILAKHVATAKQLVQMLLEEEFDLLIIDRNLKTGNESLRYGLTNFVDAATQALDIPVLLLPERDKAGNTAAVKNPERILLESAHLTGDSQLVNWAVRFTEPTDSLILAHIEDDTVFETYADAIEKIPEISTDVAVPRLKEQLLKMPGDFSQAVIATLAEKVPGISVSAEIRFGHSIADFGELIAKHDIEMLVLASNAADQLAMNSSAYSLAVEVKDIPILLV